MTLVWVFNGNGGNFPSAVFSSVKVAEPWIAKHSLTGVLTQYSVDTPSADMHAVALAQLDYQAGVSAQAVGEIRDASVGVAAVWIFNEGRTPLPSAIFADEEIATLWIKRHARFGVLTQYPVDIAVYEWVIERGYFDPTRSKYRQDPGAFSSGYQKHLHFHEDD